MKCLLWQLWKCVNVAVNHSVSWLLQLYYSRIYNSWLTLCDFFACQVSKGVKSTTEMKASCHSIVFDLSVFQIEHTHRICKISSSTLLSSFKSLNTNWNMPKTHTTLKGKNITHIFWAPFFPSPCVCMENSMVWPIFSSVYATVRLHDQSLGARLLLLRPIWSDGRLDVPTPAGIFTCLCPRLPSHCK